LSSKKKKKKVTANDVERTRPILIDRIAAQRARRNEESRSSPGPVIEHPSPQLNRQSLSSPIRRSDLTQVTQPRPSVPTSNRRVPANQQVQPLSPQSHLSNRQPPHSSPIQGSSRNSAAADRNPSRHFNHSRASSLRSNQENHPHDDIYESEGRDEDPQVSHRRHDKDTTSVSQANRDEEDDWLPVPVLRHPIPDLPNDDGAAGRRPSPETNSRPLVLPRRVTLTLKPPQKRVRRHATIQSILIFLPDVER
jgi:hypothetical protein